MKEFDQVSVDSVVSVMDLASDAPGFGFGRPGFGFGRPFWPFGFGLPFLGGLAAGALLGGAYGGYGYGGYGYGYYDPYYILFHMDIHHGYHI